MEEYSDYQLIQAYLKDRSQPAFEMLLGRYFDHTKKILSSNGMPGQDLADACQQVWIKIVRSLPSYTDKGMFGALVTTTAKNLCKDYWRSNKNRGSYSSIDDENMDMSHSQHMKAKQNIERDYQNAEAISLLTQTLIPDLAPDLRVVFLLRHESEYWDNKRALNWLDLASLFGISREQAISDFINARDALIYEHHVGCAADKLDTEELAVFLVWTQSQRIDKKDKQTEARLAALIGIPLNTFKTRYKRAREILSAGLLESQ